MNKILLVAPTLASGNGGIKSWALKFINTFKMDGWELLTVNIAVKRATTKHASFARRIIDGLYDLKEVHKSVRHAIKMNPEIRIMHTTTSGSLGTLRDYVLAKTCKRIGIKTVMHCHYGCITEDIHAKTTGRILQKTMSLYDQIWVLDKRSFSTLNNFPSLKEKVYLTPNSIEVPEIADFETKEFKRIAFIGNLIPSKGIFELIEAVLKTKHEVELFIVGPGTDDTISKIENIAGNELTHRIKIMGKMPNAEAVNFMKTVDIVALPTYYPSEAFPISILEAMSYGKLVISTNRAAIPDMLTGLDGENCGILVQEKSVDDIEKAINWCVEYPVEANNLCKKAYQKVKSAYAIDVVYDIYRANYQKLI